MELTLQKSQKLQKFHREALYPLFEQVFGIPPEMLEDYYSKGFWNPQYCPYSLFKRNRAVANVSVIPMKWIIKGEVVDAAGIQSVMTLPSERKKGYMTRLMNVVMKDLRKYPYVFLQTENPGLYERYGFKKIEEQILIIEMVQDDLVHKNMLKKIDFNYMEDMKLIQRCFSRQVENSQVFVPLHYKHSMLLNLYDPSFAEKLYYSELLDLLLVFEVSEGVLRIYDVIGSTKVDLDDICRIIGGRYSSIELHFSADQIIQTNNIKTKKKQGTLMVKGHLELGNRPIAFPITASF